MSKAAKNIINSYFTVLGSQFISAPLAFLYLSIVTRLLGPVDYGRFVLFFSSVQFFFAVFLSWMRNAIVRFGSEEFTKKQKVNEIFYVQLLISSIAFFFILALVLIFKRNISSFTGLDVKAYLYIILYLLFYALFDFATQFLLVTNRIARYGLMSLIRQGFILILVLIIFLIIKRITIYNLIFIEVFSFVILSLFATYPLIVSGYFRPVAFKSKLARSVLVYVWPVAIHVILGFFLIWADSLFIRFYLDFASVGRYEISNRLIQYISNLIMPLSIIAFPAIVSIKSLGREDIILKYIKTILPQISFFWSLFIILLLSCSPLIFKFSFGKQYTSSVLIFEVLLIGITFQILSVLCSSVLQAYNLTKAFLFITPVSVAVNLIGDFILIPRIGLIGASISKSLALVISGSLYLHNTLRGVKIKSTFGYFSLAFLIAPPVLLISILISGNQINRFLLMAVTYIIMYMYIKRVRLFKIEDISLIKKLNIPSGFKMIIEKIYIRLI